MKPPSLFREGVELRRFFSMPSETRRLVFYAERAFDFRTYEGVLGSLLSFPRVWVTYITSDPADPMLSNPPQRVQPFLLDRLLPLAIQLLDARVLVMTTPDLNRFHLRRSQRGAHHVYLFHSLVSTHMVYRFSAFDHYDTLFCAGPHHVEEIRKSESLYHLPPKKLLEIGYPRLDKMMRDHASFRPLPGAQNQKTVLVAPSWGNQNILESWLGPVARALSSAGHTVVVRPHPEAAKRRPDLIRRKLQETKPLANVVWEQDPLCDRSLHQADLLITDWSGIALEYAFATERPVLFLDVPRKINNPRYQELGLEPLEARIRNSVGRILPLSELEHLAKHADALLKNGAGYREKIRQERARWVYHPGTAADRAAQRLLALCSWL